MAIPDVTTLTDDDLDQLRQAVLTELERRRTLATAQAQADQLAQRVLAAEGVTPGQAWQQTLLGYPAGFEVTHGGHAFRSLIDHNVWEPGEGSLSYTLWLDLDSLPADGEWDPNGHTYAVGDVVTFDGATYECIQSHTSQPTWAPPMVPALWKETTA